ncbi:hypothetical protein SDC9_155328 [bioreactor metagenome]|uniref:Uncharacterized protein n=1 Tax=bioreactor metagenome TaxID=1076179 RepID=A0A645F3E8_9ZZZZ
MRGAFPPDTQADALGEPYAKDAAFDLHQVRQDGLVRGDLWKSRITSREDKGRKYVYVHNYSNDYDHLYGGFRVDRASDPGGTVCL